MNEQHLSRRKLIGYMGASVAVGTCFAASPAEALVIGSRDLCHLSFVNLHTEEKLAVYFRKGKKYIGDALQQINYVLRDFRTNQTHPIDPRLLDVLYTLKQRVGYSGPVNVISGYRSPKTNSYLHEHSSGVAVNSYHTKGMAIDIRFPGVKLSRLHDAALALKAGGVGYYPESDFVHVDVGPVRRWG
ncbi:MAG: YcbK family protein [Alphaproteobacteria bacterium]